MNKLFASIFLMILFSAAGGFEAGWQFKPVPVPMTSPEPTAPTREIITDVHDGLGASCIYHVPVWADGKHDDTVTVKKVMKRAEIMLCPPSANVRFSDGIYLLNGGLWPIDTANSPEPQQRRLQVPLRPR